MTFPLVLLCHIRVYLVRLLSCPYLLTSNLLQFSKKHSEIILLYFGGLNFYNCSVVLVGAICSRS